MDSKISGVEVGVVKRAHPGSNQEEEVSIAPDGYLGELESGSYAIRLRFCSEPKSGCHLYPLIVEGSRETEALKLLRNRTTEAAAQEGRAVYKRTVPVLQNTGHEYPYPSPACNSLQVLEIWPNGQANLWETSIVAQAWLFHGQKSDAGKFFLTEQLVYSFQCYQNGSQPVCPRFAETRPALAKYVCQLPDLDLGQLPAVDEYQPEQERSFPGLGQRQGLVLWFSQRLGYGALATTEGNAYVSWQELSGRSESRLHFLKPGELVKIGQFVPQSGHSFPLKALDVSLLTTRLD